MTKKTNKRARSDDENYVQQEAVKKPKIDSKKKAISSNDTNVLHDLANIDEESEFGFDDDDDDESISPNGDAHKRRVLTREQRLAANVRERKRVNIMNGAFANLRQALPIATGRKRRKMSRLDIVEGAIEYIQYLDELLANELPGPIDFDSYQNNLFFLDQ